MPTTSKKRFLGRKARLYVFDAWASTTGTRVDTRDTLAVNRGKQLEEVTAEDSDDEQWQQAVLNTRGIEFSMFFNQDGMDDPLYELFDDAFEGDEPLVVVVAYGDIETVGTRYRKMELYCTTFNDQLDTKGAGKVSITLTPGPTANKPTTVIVAGGGGG